MLLLLPILILVQVQDEVAAANLCSGPSAARCRNVACQAKDLSFYSSLHCCDCSELAQLDSQWTPGAKFTIEIEKKPFRDTHTYTHTHTHMCVLSQSYKSRN